MPVKALKTRSEWDNAGENVPVLHMFDRAKNHPNASPYPIKLETFFRAANIEYMVDYSKPFSPKGKSPWMTLNKQDISDSQMCIDHVIKVMPDKDLDFHLSAAEKAVALSFRSLLEDNLYFVFLMKRYSFDQSNYLLEQVVPALPVPKILAPATPLIMLMFRKRFIDQAKGQGIGLHTKEEILDVGKRDLKAVSAFLGDKPYLMGEKITSVDRILFGFMCFFILWHERG